jgi:hypothetical protein
MPVGNLYSEVFPDLENSKFSLHSNSCSPENGRIRAVKFRPKICGRILFDLGEFRPMSSQKFADLGEIHPNRQNFARNFLGRNLTARIRPFQTSFAQKKITV